jgi:subtilisin family serine protease
MVRILTTMLAVVLVACTQQNECVPNRTTQIVKTKATKKINIKSPEEIRVMVIDTGIDEHPKLKGHVQFEKTEEYIDRNGHGTHVTGILIYGNKMLDEKGNFDASDELCKNVKIYSCKYFDSYSELNALNQGVKCIEKAIEMKIDYINYSGGGGEFSQSEYDALKKFTATGGKAYVAAGNERWNLSKTPYYPASYGLSYGNFEQLSGVIPVANIQLNGKLASSSNFAPHLAAAVGVNILSTLPDSSYGFMTGTSQATPAVLHTVLRRKCEQLNRKK